MRNEIYRAVAERLRQSEVLGIKHVDLWNRNIEFVEQETPWEMPAVFVEFGAVDWRAVVPGQEYSGTLQVILHIVTSLPSAGGAGDMADEVQGVEWLDIADSVAGELMGLSGEEFGRMNLRGSHTNHDHEEMVESVEVFECEVYRHLP